MTATATRPVAAAKVTATRPSGRRGDGFRQTVALSVLVGLVAGALVLFVVGMRNPLYEGRVGLIASPVSEQSGSAAQYGEVVSLVLPALVELARSPSVLAEATSRVPDGPTPAELGANISVELVPASGLARLSVRAPSAEAAGALVFALAGAIIDADLLQPVSTLRLLDDRADLTRVAPDWPLVIGLALGAAAAAGVATAVLRNLPRSGRSAEDDAVRAALESAGLRPAAVLRGDDPRLVDRLQMLCAAAARPAKALAVVPELADRAESLNRELAAKADGTAEADPAVIAVARRGRGPQDELTATVGVLPENTVLVAVVLT
ncbi:YveK family protein [Actinokineospora iranica]|uniref:Capsular polysaccharide biosynthesis protein n=1 Tax=Actinokineospora iranica TaxID=1271860 RepID=A0A1G6XEW9_9PSEU|nr:hypothetical protein [Actinokineospora iranica]SDD75887.1 Capsular polysaccharide biosynthesis protein [Actinokineospora iranica]